MKSFIKLIIKKKFIDYILKSAFIVFELIIY